MQRYDIIGQAREGGARSFTREGGGARSFVRSPGTRTVVNVDGGRRLGGFPFRRRVDLSFNVSPWWNWWGGGWPYAWNWGYVQPWYAYPGYQRFQSTPRFREERVQRAYAEWRQAEAARAEPTVVAQLKARFEALLFA